jgi:lipopolysaccharide O-acetyltransferase
MRMIAVRSASILLLILFRLPDRVASWVKSALISCQTGWCDFLVHHSSRILGLKYIRVGPGFRAGRGLWMQAVHSYNKLNYEPRLSIGPFFGCSDYVHIACSNCVEIGEHVLVGSHVLITDHMHGHYSGVGVHSTPLSLPIERPLVGKSVLIGDRVFIGDSVRVLPGSVIGTGCVIACNSVVNSALPENSICGGIPARPMKRFDEASKQWKRM